MESKPEQREKSQDAEGSQAERKESVDDSKDPGRRELTRNRSNGRGRQEKCFREECRLQLDQGGDHRSFQELWQDKPSDHHHRQVHAQPKGVVEL